jgi:dolichol kinase
MVLPLWNWPLGNGPFSVLRRNEYGGPEEAMKQTLLVRALFHVSGSLIPLIYLLMGKTSVLIVTASFLALLVVLDLLRIKGLLKSGFVQNQLKEKESKSPTGSIFYLVSCLLAILLFDKLIASASIFVLAISDPLSSIIGRRWGKRPFFGKSMEGTGAFLFSSLIILGCFHFKTPALIGAACVATAVELFTSRFVDDNLTIPLVTGVALTILTR